MRNGHTYIGFTLCSHFFGDGQNCSLSARLRWEQKKSKNRICLYE